MNKDMKEMDWDSEQWRSARDDQLMHWVGDHDAVSFFLDLSHFIEIFDDLVDQDVPVSKGDMSKALFAALYHIPLNPFFNRHRALILPHIFASINAWIDSNELSSGDKTDRALAFALKGMGVEVLLSIIAITRGLDYVRSVSLDVRRALMGHQSFEDYCEELDNEL